VPKGLIAGLMPVMWDGMMKKILVVDDEEQMRHMLEDMLSAEYEVTLAENGREAEALISNTNFDLMITDLVMPEMNGIELVISVKNKKPTQRIIAISGGGITGHFDYLPVVQLLGVNQIFAKPFELHELMAAVKSILD
jgi:DNA-binding response OmpR family regulator